MPVELGGAVAGQHHHAAGAGQVLLGRGRVVDHRAVVALDDPGARPGLVVERDVVEGSALVVDPLPQLGDGGQQVESAVLLVDQHPRPAVLVLDLAEGVAGPPAGRAPHEEPHHRLARRPVGRLDPGKHPAVGGGLEVEVVVGAPSATVSAGAAAGLPPPWAVSVACQTSAGSPSGARRSRTACRFGCSTSAHLSPPKAMIAEMPS